MKSPLQGSMSKAIAAPSFVALPPSNVQSHHAERRRSPSRSAERPGTRCSAVRGSLAAPPPPGHLKRTETDRRMRKTAASCEWRAWGLCRRPPAHLSECLGSGKQDLNLRLGRSRRRGCSSCKKRAAASAARLVRSRPAHRCPFGKIDGPAKGNETNLNECHLLLVKLTQKGTPSCPCPSTAPLCPARCFFLDLNCQPAAGSPVAGGPARQAGQAGQAGPAPGTEVPPAREPRGAP